MRYKTFKEYLKNKWGKVDLITGMDYKDLLKIATEDYNLTKKEFRDILFSYYAQCEICNFLYNKKYGYFVEKYDKKMCYTCGEMNELGELEIEEVNTIEKL